VIVDNLVGIVFGGCGKLLMHPKLDVDEEGSAEISVGAIDDGMIRQCIELKPVGGVCQSFMPLVVRATLRRGHSYVKIL